VQLVRHPVALIWRRWNWKSAVTSAVTRAALFFCANLGAGLPAATAALNTELVFRFATSGFYGAVTQAFRYARPERTATLAAMVLLPLLSHSLELLVHWQRGTARLTTSIAWSVGFTALSTAFNLFAMRRGVLIVGEGRRSLVDDLRAMPRLVFAFTVTLVAGVRRLLQRMSPIRSL
jgi:hypothetical protein